MINVREYCDLFVSSVYGTCGTVPPGLTLLAATLVALTIELPERFKLSPTGNSFILLSLTTNRYPVCHMLSYVNAAILTFKSAKSVLAATVDCNTLNFT